MREKNKKAPSGNPNRAQRKAERAAARETRRRINKEVDEYIRQKNGGHLYTRDEVISFIVLPAIAATTTTLLLSILKCVLLPW